ncbi:MAG: F0F1 ATP synthase subunit B [Chloroflexota bacterium]|nr:F0F1 ATP synthase subunit B [Chloroflexota bacterium]
MGEMVSSLGISWQGLIVQLVNFGLLLLLMGMFAYKPIIKMLDERSVKIKEGLEKSDEAEKRAVEIDAEAKKALEEARKEGQVLIAQAKEAADKRREEDITQAKKDAEALLERARAEILLEKDWAISELRKEFADITIFAAEKVINEELDAEKHRKVIDEVLQASSFKE